MPIGFELYQPKIRLGKAPVKGSPKLLHLSSFTDTTKQPPKATNFWSKRVKFPLRTFGNTEHGSCTRSKQAIAAMRMERIETRRTPSITDKSVIDVYYAMTSELYQGGDTGAYEMDALAAWRKPEKTFKDTKGRALTIDAFTRINHANLIEVKNAIALAGAHGIAVCFALPFAWMGMPGGRWDIPEGHQPIGTYTPYSWGGHSMWAVDYNEEGVILSSTWGYKDHLITWRAFSIYCDEAYFVVDSWNYWKKTKKPDMDLDGLKKEVNRVSSTKIL